MPCTPAEPALRSPARGPAGYPPEPRKRDRPCGGGRGPEIRPTGTEAGRLKARICSPAKGGLGELARSRAVLLRPRTVGCKDLTTTAVGKSERSTAARLDLIWRVVCQGVRHEFLAFAVAGRRGLWSAGVGGGPAGCARRAVRLICAGLGCRRTMVRRGEPLSSIGRGRPGGRVAHRSVAGSPRVAGPPPTQPTGSRMFGLVVTRFG